MSEIYGDFVNHINIYLRSENLKNISYEEEEFFVELSRYLNCDCFISDNSLNSYSMILIKNGICQNVNLVPEDYENELYMIKY